MNVYFTFRGQDLREKLKDSELLKLNLIQTDPMTNFSSLHPQFQTNLHNALICGGVNNNFGQQNEQPDKNSVDTKFLDSYALEAWESVLHYLVGTQSRKLSKSLLHLLRNSGLMDLKGDQLDVKVQVWAFLLQYLDSATDLHMDSIDMLNFLFQLGNLEFGKDYSLEVLTDTQKIMLTELKHMGLVYQRNKKSSRFYPTRLATSLTSGQMISSSDSSQESEGYIVLETNYRLYAYCISPLQIAVLSLFVDLKARFPNMVVGLITRDKVREALEKGITAEQIISYLTSHAHPEMRKSNPVLPVTVIDQLRLWELEKHRIKAVPALLFSEMSGEQEFNDILEIAKRFNCLVFANKKDRSIVVNSEGGDKVKSEYRRIREERRQNRG
ncbi:RNA polymerase II transcription factor B 52 kDa subunit [Lobulomyces angularis]|nr:RNA polymerase II transcription factor B 52 kDa subunit [Lobulomyces angularis]